MSTTEAIPEVVTLTLDRDLDGPDWPKIRAAAKAKHVFPDTLIAIEEIRAIWDNPAAAHLTLIEVRDGKTLIIGEGPGETPHRQRLMIDRLKRLGAMEAGGFDGPMALGTRDRQFAYWFTPDVIWDEINENDELDPDDFDLKAIEDASRSVLNRDMSYCYFDLIRGDIIDAAKSFTEQRRSTSEVGASDGH